MKYWRYFKYVMRHKLFVFQEGRKLGLPIFQLLVHDLSKFLPDEFLPYAEWFYGFCGGSWHGVSRVDDFYASERDQHERRFEAAWLKHLHRNPHHWQHWVLKEDSGKEKVLSMPDKDRREMLADWRGAGRAIHGKDETASWYQKTCKGRKLDGDTRVWVEEQLGVLA